MPEGCESAFHVFAEAMPNHVWTSPADGLLDWFNQRVYDYCGAVPGELDGQVWTRMVHPADLPLAQRRWAESLRSGETLETEFRLLRKDGAYRWHLARAVPIGAQGPTARWIGTNTDIHDQKAAVQAVAHLNSTLEQQIAARTCERDGVWRVSRDLVVMSTLDGRVRGANPAWSVLGYASNELIGTRFEALMQESDQETARGCFGRLRQGQAVRDLDLRMRANDGSHPVYSWHLVPDADTDARAARRECRRHGTGRRR
jgi:PAS domain S-box-containing protein